MCGYNPHASSDVREQRAAKRVSQGLEKDETKQVSQSRSRDEGPSTANDAANAGATHEPLKRSPFDQCILRQAFNLGYDCA